MPLTRSQQMSRIRGRDTTPERLLADVLRALGLDFRAGATIAPRLRPDLVFDTERVAVFIDGCFWHGCPEHYVRPRTRTDFWQTKLRANFDRDHAQTAALEAGDWRVLRLWEHEVREDQTAAATRVVRCLADDGGPPEAWHAISVVPVAGEADLERWTLAELRDGRTRTVERVRTTHKGRRRHAG